MSNVRSLVTNVQRFAPLALIAMALPGQAAVIYSTGFETPTFTTGAIAGQNGWGVFGPGISTVENTLAKTGSQAVFVDGGTASQSGPFHADTTTGPMVDLSADIAIFTATTQTAWQFAATGPGLLGYMGGIDIEANNNIEAITGAFPVIGVFTRATSFNSTTWHHIDLLFNMIAQTYTITLDGSTLGSNLPFCGNNSGACSGAAVTSYGDGLFNSFGTGNDSGYMDNYQLSAFATTPEPSSLFLFLTSLCGIAALKRYRSTKV
jgi:hypothetical protein